MFISLLLSIFPFILYLPNLNCQAYNIWNGQYHNTSSDNNGLISVKEKFTRSFPELRRNAKLIRNIKWPESTDKISELLRLLPTKQRELLQAAISNGELPSNPDKLLPIINTVISQYQYSPIVTATPFVGLQKWLQKFERMIQNHRPILTQERQQKPVFQWAKLPHYGEYCGNLRENLDFSRRRLYNVQGSVWAPDQQHLVVTKFTFRPSFIQKENITFWIGPKKKTYDNVADMFPSENGIYLTPEPLNFDMNLDINRQNIIIVKVPNSDQIDQISNSKNEIEQKPEPEPIIKRSARSNFFPPKWPENPEELYGREDNGTEKVSMQSQSFDSKINKKDGKVQLIVDEGIVNAPTSNLVKNKNSISIVLNHLDTISNSLDAVSETIGNPDERIETKQEEKIDRLSWYAGYQPLVLQLPQSYRINDAHWISLWDHDKGLSIASTLIPSGPGFHIPEPVILRGFQSNGFRNVSSGPIRIIDSKTMQIKDFSFEKDVPGAWFMVGKNLIPNSKGKIVPIFLENDQYDCDFLKSYSKQTVTLKLPGDMNIKDVFWLSVFCIPYGISFSQIYLPYNDIHVPSDLTHRAMPPNCILESNSR